MPLAFTGPIGLTFNYADESPGFSGAPQLFWLASAFDTPDYAAVQLMYAKEHPHPLDLLWGAKWMTKGPEAPKRPLDIRFRRDNLVYLRSAWNDRRALFVGGDRPQLIVDYRTTTAAPEPSGVILLTLAGSVGLLGRA
jgi:hypothetical protein